MIKNKSQSITCISVSKREFPGRADGKAEDCQSNSLSILKSEKGVALLMVLILSAVSLMLMTAMLYMITVGTQTSGMNKRYRNALEAGIAGSDITNLIINLRGDNTAITNFVTALNGSLNPSLTPAGACNGTAYSSGVGATFTGAAAKIISSSSTWNGTWPGCSDTSLSADKTAYDFKFTLGTSPQFNVYAKIVNVVEGNTGSTGSSAGNGHQLSMNPTTGSGNEIPTPTIPYQYTVEVDAENASPNSGDRAKLSILYQY
jgi:hypothetical protein